MVYRPYTWSTVLLTLLLLANRYPDRPSPRLTVLPAIEPTASRNLAVEPTADRPLSIVDRRLFVLFISCQPPDFTLFVTFPSFSLLKLSLTPFF